jgi:oligopeptide/dipeptide ABC transporter ATP-binding protein
MNPLLQVRDLTVTFDTEAGRVHAIHHVDLELPRGITLGLVGESGCGKSTLGRAILRILAENGSMTGRITFDGRDLQEMTEKDLRTIRGRNIAMVFQDPATRLNPLMRIRDHFLDTLRSHEPEMAMEEALDRARRVLADVRVPADRLGMYPHELSGGMRQRIMIALSLLFHPTLLIADEPTTSLDVIIEAQILELLGDLMDQYDMSVLLITHNLGLVAQFADRVAVMYAGEIVEEAETVPLFQEPKHPYTQGLLRSVIDLETTKLYSVGGTPPDLLGEPKGCPFYPRCEQRLEVCQTVDPTPRALGDAARRVACHLYPEAG